MPKATSPAQLQVAPAWHTALLVGLILVVAITGVCTSRSSHAAPVITPSTRLTSIYLPSIVVAWALAAYVCRLGRPRSALAFLVGEPWTSASRAFGDLVLSAAAFFLIEACELGAAALSHGALAPESVRALLPSTPLEQGVWVAFAVSVGVSEELVYRGYLRVQLTAFTRKPSLGIFFQGILFGIAHLDQGWASAARLAFYGIALGALAEWRRSLLPGIMAHVAIDLASGLTHR